MDHHVRFDPDFLLSNTIKPLKYQESLSRIDKNVAM
jgi:hypothetical protein